MIGALLALALARTAVAAHGYALWGDLKYPAGFDHFDYVNLKAPEGGDLRLVSSLRISTFDKYNPFSLKGNAPAYLDTLVFESLLTTSLDEPGSAYGLLADDVTIAPDRRSITFHLNPAARFSNGDPVLAEDVQHSFKMLTGPGAQPAYRSMLADVKGIEVLDSSRVRFDLVRFTRDVPLVVGGLPVFSRKWGAGKPFDALTTDKPIASGPYAIGPVRFGRDITYVKRPDYWASNLNVRRGQFHFARVTVKIYKDNTARLEGFKAGEFDLIQEFVSRDWARQYRGGRFEQGTLVKRELPNRFPYGFQGHVINIRNPQYADVRVREALTLALDFEWMNRMLFYGAYRRVQGYFGGGDFQAQGTPQGESRSLLEALRARYGDHWVPPAVFGPLPPLPTTDPPNSLRGNLRRAQALLAQAGWTYRDGALRDRSGKPFVLEFLDSQEGGMRTLTPWVRALARLGIRFDYRPVDFSIYQERLRNFQFEVTTIRLPGTTAPGSELRDLFGSRAANTPDSNNFWGIANPAVDALIEDLINAPDKPAAMAAGQALDRLLTLGHYSVPQWYSNSYRVAYDAQRLGVPPATPGYFTPETWAMATWWHLPSAGKAK